ncbi:MAG: AlpA family phage regulatory protein [Agitococcus sp.]|nr:AlpA family phage regulatory protein [Agitococcus sp.]
MSKKKLLVLYVKHYIQHWQTKNFLDELQFLYRKRYSIVTSNWRLKVLDQSKSPRILRLKEVQNRIGLGKSTIYDRINPRSPRYDRSFPRPVKLGTSVNGSVGWLEESINAWISARIAA